MRIDPELYPVELEKASGKGPEDWNMECCMCECSLHFVNLPKGSEAQRIWRDVDIHELARDEFVQGFADSYGLVKGWERDTGWDLRLG